MLSPKTSVNRVHLDAIDMKKKKIEGLPQPEEHSLSPSPRTMI